MTDIESISCLKIPKVSVCIPAYNQPECLKITLDSVIRQTYKDFEIIITDDSPGDLVKNFICQYPDKEKKIKYYKNQIRLGTPENWNECIRRSTGEYIKILHHDDYLNSESSLAKFVQLLDDNPKSDFAFCAIQLAPQRGAMYHRIISRNLVNAIQANPLLLFADNWIGAPSTTIFRKKSDILFNKNLKWIVDVEFYLEQMRTNRRIVYLPELLVLIGLQKGRVSDQCINNKQIQVYEYLTLLEKIYAQENTYDRKSINSCIIQVIYIFNTYGIRSRKDIAACGYFGRIPTKISFYLLIISTSTFLARLYVKILRIANVLHQQHANSYIRNE
ncbi:MAG: glycosyltransferase family 2 protein [Ginsengibacter sp.]